VTPLPAQRSRWRIGPVIAAVLLAVVAAGVCGALGWWQWERAQSQGQIIVPGPPVPIADVDRPGETTRGIGRLVEVRGSWADAPAAYVPGRAVEGTDAVLLVLPLRVDADATGTGREATLAVLAGWLPADQVPATVEASGPVGLTGSLRSSEAVGTVQAGAGGEPLVISQMSTAALAQVWEAPVYTPVLEAREPYPGWNAFPPPPPERRLDIRSVTYAGEWWLFGAFAVFLAGRWIRDNGRVGAGAPDEPDASEVEQA